jgi:hypothetical protein
MGGLQKVYELAIPVDMEFWVDIGDVYVVIESLIDLGLVPN